MVMELQLGAEQWNIEVFLFNIPVMPTNDKTVISCGDHLDIEIEAVVNFKGLNQAVS